MLVIFEGFVFIDSGIGPQHHLWQIPAFFMDFSLQQTCSRLYQENRDDIYAFLIRSLRDENLAMDLLQDVFLNFYRVFQEKKLPPNDGECRMYLFKIARNLMINHAQSAYQRKVDLVEDADRAGAAHSPSAETEVLASLDHDRAESILQEALAELPEKERSILQLRYHAELKLEEIANILDTSISSSSRRIQLAEKKLRHICEKKGFRLS